MHQESEHPGGPLGSYVIFQDLSYLICEMGSNGNNEANSPCASDAIGLPQGHMK